MQRLGSERYLPATSSPRLMTFSRLALGVTAALIALLIPFSAYAWNQAYVQNTTFNQGGIGLSDFNSGINFNHVNWNAIYNIFGLSLCNASYQCYDYDYSGGGYNQDLRTISYGRAKCYYPNPESTWVYYCETSN